MSHTKYLYLAELEFANTWINGGKIPIKDCSEYQDIERMGIKTPDEGYDRSLRGIQKKDFERIFSVDNIPKGQLKIEIGSIMAGNRKIGDKMIYHSKSFYGYLFSCSNSFNEQIMYRLNKKVCVKIVNIDELNEIISTQLKIIGEAGKCTYTQSFDRSVFIKGMDDAWQDEYRLFWKNENKGDTRWITIPQGIAQLMDKK